MNPTSGDGEKKASGLSGSTSPSGLRCSEAVDKQEAKQEVLIVETDPQSPSTRPVIAESVAARHASSSASLGRKDEQNVNDGTGSGPTVDTAGGVKDSLFKRKAEAEIGDDRKEKVARRVQDEDASSAGKESSGNGGKALAGGNVDVPLKSAVEVPKKSTEAARTSPGSGKDVGADKETTNVSSANKPAQMEMNEKNPKRHPAESPEGGNAEPNNPEKNRVGGQKASEEEGEDDEDGELDLSGMRKHEYEQVAKFDTAQLQRYEQYRRSDLKKEKIKKVLTAINPLLAKSSDPFLIAVKGLAKVFVGDVVEAALEVREQNNETGALQPKHLREAYRRMQRAGMVPSTMPRQNAFR